MSNFRYSSFTLYETSDYCICVSKENYSQAEAIKIALGEFEWKNISHEKPFLMIEDMFVRYHFGVVDDEKINSWWLEEEHFKTSVPVWAFYLLNDEYEAKKYRGTLIRISDYISSNNKNE